MANTQMSLADLVNENGGAVRILQRHRLDFCCGGQRTIEAACAQAGVDPEALLAEIDQATAGRAGSLQVEGWSPAQLVDHIVERYHVPLREDVPRLYDLAARVEHRHVGKPDCPAGLALHLQGMQQAIEIHLAKEEQILFPMIRAGRGHLAQMPVQVMMQEHDDHGQSLRRIRQLTRDFRLPSDACNSWRALYDGLLDLERELMEHIHLENNVLFPEVLAGS